MLLKHEIELLEALHTGADKSLGIVKPFRREVVLLKNPIPVESYFEETEKEQLLRVQLLALYLFKLRIPEQNNFRKGIDTEIRDAVVHAATKASIASFHSTLVERFEISQESLNSYSGIQAMDILELFTDQEIVDVILYKDVIHYIMSKYIKLRTGHYEFKKDTKDTRADKTSLFTEEINEETGLVNELVLLEKEVAEFIQEVRGGSRKRKIVSMSRKMEMPTMASNGIRGKFRRKYILWFLHQVGITYDIFEGGLEGLDDENKTVKFTRPLDNYLYHTFFTGGTLTGGFFEGEKDVEDLDMKETLIKYMPPIAFFGCAVGKKMIEGLLIVHNAYPKCKELGNGDMSVQAMMDITFSTRSDSSKSQQNIKLKTRYIINAANNLESYLNQRGIVIRETKKLTDIKKGKYQYMIVVSEKQLEKIKEDTGLIVEAKPYSETHQMFYQYECLTKGTVMTTAIGHQKLTSPMAKSCFGHMIEFFCQEPYMGAKSSVGKGHFDATDLKQKLAELQEQDADYKPDLYLNYIEENKEKIAQFLSPKGLEAELTK